MVSFIGLSSALDFDNIVSEKQIAKGDSYIIGDKVLDYNNLWEKYPVQVVKNVYGIDLPIIGGTLAEVALTKHTEGCGTNCDSEFTIVTNQESALIDDVIFLKNESGRWVESSIRSYNFQIFDNAKTKVEGYYEDVCSGASYDEKTGEQLTEDVCEKVYKERTVYYKLVDDYTTDCKDTGVKNETGNIYDCKQIVSGTHEEVYSGYSNYQIGTKLPAGTYTVKLEGNKREDWTYDWQIKTQGKLIENLAVWGETDMTSNLVAQYKLNTNSNQTIVVDTTGNNNGTLVGKTFNNGTVSGGVTIEDGAMKFNGVNGYVATNISQGLNLSSSYSISTWFKTDINQSNIIVTLRNGTTFPSSTIQFSGSGANSHQLKFLLQQNSTCYVNPTTTGLNKDDNIWHNAVFVWNGTTIFGYIDNVLSVTSTLSDTCLNLLNSQTQTYLQKSVFIGSYGTSGYFNGSVDETLIFNRSLSSSEIAGLYAQGRTQYTNVTSGLVAQYSGRDYSGTAGTPTTIQDTNQLSQGKINQAFNFDGNQNYIESSNVSINAGLFNQSGTYTVSNWLKFDSLKALNVIWNYQGGNNNRIMLVSNSAGGLTFNRYNGSAYTAKSTPSGTFSTNQWYYVTAISNNGVLRLLVDNVEYNITSAIYASGNDYHKFRIGYGSSINSAYAINGSIDDVRIYNRSLSAEEISYLYNNGNGREDSSNAYVTLNSPLDGSIQYTNSVNLSASANVTNGAILVNATLYDNSTGSWGARNSSTYTNSGNNIAPASSTTFSETVVKTGFKIQTKTAGTLLSIGRSSGTTAVGALLQDSSQNTVAYALFSGDVATFDYKVLNNTVYYVKVWSNGSAYTRTEGSGISYPVTTQPDINFIAGTYNDGDDNQYARSIKNITLQVGITSTTQTFTNTYSTGSVIKCNYQFCDSDGACEFATSNYTFSIDSQAPTINILSGNGTQNYGTLNINHTINFTVTDTNLNYCQLEYNGSTRSLPCYGIGTDSVNFTLQQGVYNATIYAVDAVGNVANKTVSWDYYVFENSRIYNPTAIEGSIELFTSNITSTPSYRLSTATLLYNGTEYDGTIQETSTDNYYLSINVLVPQVDVVTNLTFYWILVFENNQTTNFTSLQQQIYNISMDNCGINTNQLFNLTMRDETTQDILNGTTQNTSIRIDVHISSYDDSIQVANYSSLYNNTNPARVCINNNLLTSVMRMDATIQYSSNGRFVEFYNIQNYTLTNSTQSQNISLYDLNSSIGQEYKITYKGVDFIPVSDLVIQIQRKYIDEGVFKTIEIPISGTNGYTIAHLVTNDVVYNLLFIKNGVLLDTFIDVIATCQNPSFTTCEINLNALVGGTDLFGLISESDFISSLSYDRDTRTISSTYAITSGVSGTTNLQVYLADNFGTTNVCNDSLVSAGGTLACIVPQGFGNATIQAKIILNGDTRRSGYISMNQKPKEIYNGILIVMALIMILFMIGIGVQDNPMIMGVFLALGLLVLIGLNLVYSTSWIGTGATVLWFVLAVAVILIKGGNKR
jgi:hypothetical protein